MTFPWYRMTVPPEWRCPNCRRGLQNVDCWCGSQSSEVTPRPSDLSKTQKIYTDFLKREPFDQMRQRLLQRGQRQLKSQAEYLLQHMGLSEHQLQKGLSQGKVGSGSDTFKLQLQKLQQSTSLPQLSSRSRSVRSSLSRGSGASGEAGPQDPVMAYIMHGPPAYSPTLAGMASAASAALPWESRVTPHVFACRLDTSIVAMVTSTLEACAVRYNGACLGFGISKVPCNSYLFILISIFLIELAIWDLGTTKHSSIILPFETHPTVLLKSLKSSCSQGAWASAQDDMLPAFEKSAALLMEPGWCFKHK